MKMRRKLNLSLNKVSERKKRWTWILLSVLTVAILIFVYSNFIYYAHCKDEACFLNHLKNCDRASYIKSGNLSVAYKITGQAFRTCGVEVDLENVSQSFELRPVYYNSDMSCNIKLGAEYYPEADLAKCSGLLKEGFQEVLISRLKVEIMRNIGDINLNIFGE